MPWTDTLPEDIQRQTYYAGREAAWPQQAALRVIDHATRDSIAVPGVEVWIPTNPGPTIPTPFIYTWSAEDRRTGEDWSDFVRRVNTAASEYIRTFEWDRRDERHREVKPYFNLDIVCA